MFFRTPGDKNSIPALAFFVKSENQIRLKVMKISQLTGFEGGEPNIDEPKPESAKLVEPLERFLSGVVNMLFLDGHWKLPLCVILFRSASFLPIFFIVRSST